MPLNEDGTCPVGCGRNKGEGKLTCYQCWRHIPRHLQNDVYRTWRAWRADLTDPDKMRAYKAAAEAAISAAA